MSVVIETTVGDITVDLFVDERPRACMNFIKLCKLKYYNYNLFHTIMHGFIAQTGDQTGAGDGGESVWGITEGSGKRFFQAEMVPKIKHSAPGLLSMVGSEQMIGSQFFFTLGEDLTSLDGIHCVIGEVVEGLDVLRQLNDAICDEKHRPYKDIRVTHTVILEDPFPNPRGFKEPSRSPSPSAERLKGGRIGADEDIDDMEGKTEAEINEMLQEREAKARATILEIVGDLPDAEIAPPENVLFVCKLNPVTTDDDLDIIFSRFGKVKSCEVIRDRVTGDSLQYAFIEFEDRKACEAAYFKMDNVLIDDRRIHVDFSQSVSKIKWHGKGRVFYKDNDDREFKNSIDSRPNGNQKYGNNNRSSGNDSKRNDRKSPERRRPQFDNRRFDRNNRNERDYRPDNRNRYERPAFRNDYRDNRQRDRRNDRSRSRDMDRNRTYNRRDMDRQNDRNRQKDERDKKRQYRSKSRDRSRSREKRVHRKESDDRKYKHKKSKKDTDNTKSRRKHSKHKKSKRRSSTSSSSSSDSSSSN